MGVVIESDQDDFLDKRKKISRNLNLYLQLPDEEIAEVIKDYEANFYDISPESKPDGSDMRLRLYDVVMFLKKQGYPLENTYISYYSSVFSAFVNCNLDPVSKTIWLMDDDLEKIDSSQSLRLKFQKGLCRQFTENEDGDIQDSCSENNDNIQPQPIHEHQNISKMKERTIGYVIEKVAQWRRLYNGYYDQNFNHHRMSLERAADKVGVSKKSLDDYLAQLRAGRQFGYDFNANKEKKVGDLRRFVKDKIEPSEVSK